MRLFDKYDNLLTILSRYPDVSVAFSGGVDSTLLFKAGVEVFGSQTVAFFADSILQKQKDVADTQLTAAAVGGVLRHIKITPLLWPEFSANPRDRCYQCKKKIYRVFMGFLPGENSALLDGTNRDDLQEERPGHKAIVELGVKTPLVEADLSKEEIRRLAKKLGLPNWDRPSASCLATRIPAGTIINDSRIDLVRQCEEFLEGFGFAGCRAKFLDEAMKRVKIEVIERDMAKIGRPEIREKLFADLDELGVEEIFVDLRSRP